MKNYAVLNFYTDKKISVLINFNNKIHYVDDFHDNNNDVIIEFGDTRIVKIFGNEEDYFEYWDFRDECFIHKYGSSIQKTKYYVMLNEMTNIIDNNEYMFEAEDDKSAELLVISQLIL